MRSHRGDGSGKRVLRGKIHSSLGGRKAHPDFELKDHRPPEAAALRAVLDFKVRIRSGLPCGEWASAAEAAALWPHDERVSSY
jgi:hypothetical protein